MTPRRRRRQRTTQIPVADDEQQLRLLGDRDHANWRAVRAALDAVCARSSSAAAWLGDLSPAAVDPDGVLLLDCATDATAMRAWIARALAV